MLGGPVVIRSGKPRVVVGAPPADVGAFASEADAIVSKFLDNRPTTWFRIENTGSSLLFVFFQTPLLPVWLEQYWSLEPGHFIGGHFEVTNLWITTGDIVPGAFQALFAERVT